MKGGLKLWRWAQYHLDTGWNHDLQLHVTVITQLSTRLLVLASTLTSQAPQPIVKHSLPLQSEYQKKNSDLSTAFGFLYLHYTHSVLEMERFRNLLGGGGISMGGAAHGTVRTASAWTMIHAFIRMKLMGFRCMLIGQHEPHRQFRDCLHFIVGPIEDVATWSRWCSHGSHGTDARRVCGRLHSQGYGCFCHATERNGCQCRGCRPRFPDQDDGYATANWKVCCRPSASVCSAQADHDICSMNRPRICRWVVSLASRLWVLVVIGRYQHPAVF